MCTQKQGMISRMDIWKLMFDLAGKQGFFCVRDAEVNGSSAASMRNENMESLWYPLGCHGLFQRGKGKIIDM